MMRAVSSGNSVTEVGAKYGVSGNRCSQIVRMTMRRSIHSQRLKDPADNKYCDVIELRKNKEYWLERADELANIWNIKI